MKKKVITALLITMTLTLGGVGTAYAMNNDMSILSGEAVNDVNMIKEGFIWVVDKESWTETVEHPEEGHYENGKLLESEKGHYEEVILEPEREEKKWKVDKEPWTEKIEHPAVIEQVWVVDKEPWEETIEKIKYVCRCGAEFADPADWKVHDQHFVGLGDFSHGGYSNVPYHEVIKHPEEGHYEEKVIEEPYTEYIKHPEEGHWETVKIPAVIDQVWTVDKPAVYEQVWKVDKPAWTETITHPEEGHWEPIKDEEKPENPEQKPDEETPETPEQKPDEETPETPEQKPDEEKPETPEQKPDEETPETPEQKPDEQTPEKPDNSNTDNKQDSTEDTSKDKTDNKADNETDSKKEDTNTAPKTGDPTNLAYLATLAGSALVGGVSWKFRKRK